MARGGGLSGVEVREKHDGVRKKPAFARSSTSSDLQPLGAAGCTLACLLLMLLKAEGGRSAGPDSTRMGVSMPVTGMDGMHCEALPLGARAPLSLPAERGCEGCQAPLLPLAASAADTRRKPLIHPTTLGLVHTFVTGKGSRNEVGRRFAEGMLQHRAIRFLPTKLDLTNLRRHDAMAEDKTARLRHLLSLRRAVYEKYGPAVAVHTYAGDAVVHFSMMWRLAPDSYQTCNVSGKNFSVTRLAVQPVHEKILRPLWQLRLEDANDQDWNPNLLLIQSPLQDRTIPDPTHAVAATFDHFMQQLNLATSQQLNLACHLGSREEKGDRVLLAHMQLGHFGIARARSEYEEDMDSRAFAHLLYRVTQGASNGTATVHNGMLVLQRMVDAGLMPRGEHVASLMQLVIAAARNASDTTPQDLHMVLGLLTHMHSAPEHWVYMAGLEALAWAARHGKCGGLEQGQDLLMRIKVLMRIEDAQTEPHTPSFPNPSSMEAASKESMKDPDADLYACFLAVIAGAAHDESRQGQEQEDLLNVAYQEHADGTVGAQELEEGEEALSCNLHAHHMMQKMLAGNVMRNDLVYHGLLQVLVGSGSRGSLEMVQLESIIQSILDDGLELNHYHAHSLLAAAVQGLEHDKVSLAQLRLLVSYILRASLELDALCYSLWLRALTHALAQGDASLQDLLHVIHLAHEQGMRFSTHVFNVVGDGVARHVELVLGSNASTHHLSQLGQHFHTVFERMLYLGASPPKCMFDARLLLQVQAAEAGENLSGYEAECLAEDLMVAGHTPDATTLVLILRLLALANARGETGILDVARILERAICAKVVGNEAVLLATLSAAEAAALQGTVSLADAQHLLSRASVLAGTDSNKGAVLGRLLRVAGVAAQHGLATVDEALALVERLLQAHREAGAPVRLERQERDALVDVLAGAALAGTATAEDAESVMRHLDVAGERPSMRVLRVLLDVVLAESARGKATVQDAVHVLNRIKGCGFSPTHLEMSKVLSIVHASAEYGHGTLENALDALRDLRAAGSIPDTQQYLQVLDCAQWAAYWRTVNTPPHTQAQAVSSSQVVSTSQPLTPSSLLSSSPHMAGHATQDMAARAIQDPSLPMIWSPRAAHDDDWATETWHK